jgi:hypothetical protein
MGGLRAKSRSCTKSSPSSPLAILAKWFEDATSVVSPGIKSSPEVSNLRDSMPAWRTSKEDFTDLCARGRRNCPEVSAPARLEEVAVTGDQW